jgi:hypothetical protein
MVWKAGLSFQFIPYVLILIIGNLSPHCFISAMNFWHKSSIGGSNDVVGIDSTITVTLSPTIDLKAGTVFTISGLLLSATKDSNSLPVTGPSSTKWESKSGTWSQATGTLKLTNSMNFPAFCEFVFSFVLTNPLMRSTASAAQISTNRPDTAGNLTGIALEALSSASWTHPPTIRESSNVRNTPNTLTINFAVNVPIRGGSTMTIAGLIGAHTPAICNTTYICIFGGSSNLFSGVGSWDPGGILKITVADTVVISSDVLIEFEIHVVNPDFWPYAECTVQNKTCVKNDSEPSIELSCSIFSTSGMVPLRLTSAVLGNVLNCSTDNQFIIRRIWENHSFTDGINILSFELKPNFIIAIDGVIIVHGLINSGQKCFVCNLTVRGFSAPKFQANATFDTELGSLRLDVKKRILALETVLFEIRIRNGKKQSAVIPWISVKGLTATLNAQPMAMQGSVLGAGQSPTFLTASISETTSVQGAQNTLAVYFNPGFDLYPGSRIIVTGLHRSLTPSANINVVGTLQILNTNRGIVIPGSAWSNAIWDQTLGSLVLTVETKLVSIESVYWERCPLSCIYSFQFQLLNPVKPERTDDLRIIADLGWINIDSIPFILDGSNSVFRSTIPLRFDFAVVSENSNVPEESNRICVNFAFTGSIMQGRITIAGLHGSATASSNNFPIYPQNVRQPYFVCYNNSQSLFDASAGTLVVHLCGHLFSNESFSFCFDLMNSLQAQSPIAPVISYQDATINSSAIMTISDRSPDARGILSSSFIPRFVVKSVVESSVVRGGLNSVEFRFQTNFDLKVGQRILIRGLIGSDTQSTPNLSISGPSQLYFSSDAEWLRETGALTLSAHRMAPSKIVHSFSVLLKNPWQESSPRAILISAPSNSVAEEEMDGTVFSASSSAYFAIIQASESSDIPAAPNAVIITLRSSITLQRDAALIISGLTDAQGATFRPLQKGKASEISVAGISPQNALRERASWDGNGTLTFWMKEPLPPYCLLSFGFYLFNSNKKMSPPIIMATYANENTIGPVRMENDILAASGTVLLHFTATESTKVRSEENVLTFTFSSNTAFPQHQKFRIFSFIGVTWETDLIPLGGASSSQFYPCTTENNASFASWDANLTEICLCINRDSEPFENFEIVLRVFNPAWSQGPLSLKMQAIDPVSNNPTFLQGPGILSASAVCQFETSLAEADISSTLGHFLFSFSTNCKIPAVHFVEVNGLILNGSCLGAPDFSQLHLDNTSPVTTGILRFRMMSTWYPHQVETVSIWCLVNGTADQVHDLTVTMKSNSSLTQHSGFCSKLPICIPRSEIVTTVKISPLVWLRASVELERHLLYGPSPRLHTYLKPSISLPANITLTIHGFKASESGQPSSVTSEPNDFFLKNVSSSSFLWRSTFSPFNISKHCSLTKTFILAPQQNKIIDYSFQVSFALPVSKSLESPSDMAFDHSFIQAMQCRSDFQDSENRHCQLNPWEEVPVLSQCDLMAYSSAFSSNYVLKISFVPAESLPSNSSLILSGFNGLFPNDVALTATVVASASKVKALFSSLNGSIILCFMDILARNETRIVKIYLYPPRFCNNPVTSLISVTVLHSAAASESKAILVGGSFTQCIHRPTFLLASAKQMASIDSERDVANFLALDIAIDSVLRKGEIIFLHGFCGMGVDHQNLRVFGKDSEHFNHTATWRSSTCTIEISVLKILYGQYMYSLNVEILYPITNSLQLISSGNITPIPIQVDIIGLPMTSEFVEILDTECYENTKIQGAINNISCRFKPSFSLIGNSSLVFSGFVQPSFTDSMLVPIYFDFGRGIQTGFGTWIKSIGIVFRTCANCIISSQIGAMVIFGMKNSYTANEGATGIFLTLHNEFINTTKPTPLGLSSTLTSGEPSKFSKGKIYESNGVSSSLNSITVVFQPSTELASGTLITIAGITGSQTESSSSLAVIGPQSDIFSGFGQWEICAGQLTLMVQENFSVPADSESSISFWIKNSAGEQISPAISIAASGPDPNRHVILPYFVLEGKVLGSKKNSLFSVLIALEDNTIQNEINRLTFVIRTNFVLSEGATLTISGLVGSPTESTTRLPILGPDSHLFKNGSGFSVGDWNKATGTFKFTVGNKMLIGEGCSTTVSVEIKNSAACQNPIMPVFSLMQAPIFLPPNTGVGLVFSCCSSRAFKMLSIHESSAVRGALNMITISFQSNAYLPANSNVTLSGLVGGSTLSTKISYVTDCRIAWQLESCTVTSDQSKAQWGRVIVENAMLLSGSHSSRFSIECFYNAFEFTKPDPQCVWNLTSRGIFGACGGKLLLRSNTPIYSSEVTVVSFLILNPSTSSSVSFVSTVTIASDEIPQAIFSTSVLSGSDSPAWLKATIVGSSSILRGDNELTVTIRCNCYLQKNQIIELYGLNGSSTPPGKLKLESLSLSPLSDAEWDNYSGVVSISVLENIEPFEDIIFSFVLQNPDWIQKNNRIFITSFPAPHILLQAFQVSEKALASEQPFFWKWCNVSSSSPISGALNTITIDFMPATQIEAGSLISVHGFDTLLRTSVMINVSDSQGGDLLNSDICVFRCNGSIQMKTTKKLYSNISTLLTLVLTNPVNISMDFFLSIELNSARLYPASASCSGRIPILLSSAVFLVNRAYQTSSVTGAINDITFVFRPSDNLVAGSILIIYGLGRSSPSSSSTIFVSGRDNSLFSPIGSWNVTDGSLSISVAAGQYVSKDVNTSINLRIMNPKSTQVGVRASLSAMGPFGLTIPRQAVEGPLLLFTDSQPSWIDVQVHEETAVRLAQNMVTVEWQTNSILPAGTIVTLTGLNGINLSNENGDVPLFGQDASCWSGKNARWEFCSDDLVMLMSENCSAHQRRAYFQFYVMNGPVSVPPVQMAIHESSGRFGKFMIHSNNFLTSNKLPQWLNKTMHFQNNIRGSSNDLVVTIMANFRIQENSVIVFSGLRATNRDVEISGPHRRILDVLSWDPDAGDLELVVKSRQASIIPLTFSFKIDNIFTQSEYSCTGSICPHLSVHLSLYYYGSVLLNEAVDMEGEVFIPNQVSSPSISNSRIQEASRILGAPNLISIFILFNTDLPPQIEIQLHGFFRFDHFESRVAFLGPAASYIEDATGYWNQGEGKISMVLTSTLNAASGLDLSFTLKNKNKVDPSWKQHNISASVKGNTIRIPSTILEGSIGVTIESVEATFLVHTLEEQQKVPCSLNQLVLKLVPNYLITVKSKILIQGLTGSVTDNGLLVLGGLSASFFNHSALWSRKPGLLELITSDVIPALSAIHLSFAIRNPQYVQPARTPAVTTSLVKTTQLLDANGSPCSLLTASEGPHLSLQLVIVGQTVGSLSSSFKDMIIVAVAVLLEIGLANVFIDSVINYAAVIRRLKQLEQPAIKLAVRIVADPTAFSDMAAKLVVLVSNGTMRGNFEFRGVHPIFDVFFHSPPQPDLKTVFSVQVIESTAIQGSLNTISLQVHLEATVSAGASMHINSIPPNLSPSGSIFLSGSGASFFAVSKSSFDNGTALWYETGHVITLNVVNTLPASDFDIVFVLRNSGQMQSCPPIQVLIIDSSVVYGPVSPVNTVLNSQIPTYFVQRDIIEGSRSAGHPNSFAIHLSANGPLPVGTLIEISGLLGSRSISDPSMPVSGRDSYLFGNQSTWLQDNGTLILTVTAGSQISCGGGLCNSDNGIVGGQLIEINIVLLNPLYVQAPQAIYIRAWSRFFKIQQLAMSTLSCSFAWCGAKFWSDYTELQTSSCFGTSCISSSLLVIDKTAPNFSRPLIIVNSTNNSFLVEIYVSKVSKAKCITSSFLYPNVSMTAIQNGVEALPERLIGLHSQQSLSSVLRPNDRGTAEIIGLEANTMYRIFCFAEDLEVPANQMTITEVKC